MKAVLIFEFDVPDNESPEALFRKTINIAREEFRDNLAFKEGHIAISDVAEDIIAHFRKD